MSLAKVDRFCFLSSLILVVSGLGSALANDRFDSAVSPMAEPRNAGAAVKLIDGRVLLIGGTVCESPRPGVVEIFDPIDGSFAAIAETAHQRQVPAIALLGDGRVLVAGGYDNAHNVMFSDAELFDPDSSTFTPIGSMNIRRATTAVATLQDGRVLIAGGATTGGHSLSSVELYDPAKQTFSLGEMHESRSGATAVTLWSGEVLIVGGDSDADSCRATAELFDPDTNTFSMTGSMSSPGASIVPNSLSMAACWSWADPTFRTTRISSFPKRNSTIRKLERYERCGAVRPHDGYLPSHRSRDGCPLRVGDRHGP